VNVVVAFYLPFQLQINFAVPCLTMPSFFLDMCANALQIDVYIFVEYTYILTPHGSHKNKLNCCCRVENAMFSASLGATNSLCPSSYFQLKLNCIKQVSAANKKSIKELEFNCTYFQIFHLVATLINGPNNISPVF